MMDKDTLIEYHLANEKARYEAIRAITVAFRNIFITILLCITILVCAYMYFVVPVEEETFTADHGSQIYDDKLEKIYHHDALTEEEAIEYVAHMRNKDGSTGAHWTMQQTTDYMKSHSGFEMLNPNCFYVAMNMMYSDYYKPTRTTDTYAMLAKDFIEDTDAPQDKVKRYMKAMHD